MLSSRSARDLGVREFVARHKQKAQSHMGSVRESLKQQMQSEARRSRRDRAEIAPRSLRGRVRRRAASQERKSRARLEGASSRSLDWLREHEGARERDQRAKAARRAARMVAGREHRASRDELHEASSREWVSKATRKSNSFGTGRAYDGAQRTFRKCARFPRPVLLPPLRSAI